MRHFSLSRVLELAFLRSSAVFGLSGIAFAVGTLLLARAMPVSEFGAFSLLLALFNIFCLLAPAGIDQIAVRHRLRASAKLLATSIAISIALAALVAFVVFRLGHLPFWSALALGGSIAIGGQVVTASGLLRAAGRLGVATWVFTGGNWGLLAIGVVGQWIAMPSASLPFTLFLLGQTAIAVVAWTMLLSASSGPSMRGVGIPWREAPSLLGVAAIGTIVLQLERIIIPPLMDLAALATFSVLSSVAIFPFRIMTSSLEFSLTPRLRGEASAARRRALFWLEMRGIAVVLVFGTALVLLLAPWAASWITGSKYQLTFPLLLAGCVSGAVKFLQTVARSVLTACGSAADLGLLNLAGGAGLVLGALGGVLGSQLSLPGIVLGVALGFALGTVPALVRTARLLR